MTFAKDDNELALVISHEIAHNSMKHIDAKKQNMGLGFLADLATVLLSKGQVSNTNFGVKVTRYFEAVRNRPDRATIRDEWIENAIPAPLRKTTQADGRIRRWVQVLEMENRFLRVVLLADGETVHNAFFDRRLSP